MKTLLLCLTLGALAVAQNPAPALTAGNVTIPVAEYNRMVDQAVQASKRPPATPRPYVMQSADFQLRVEKGIVTGTLQLRGEALQKGAIAVAIPSGLTLRDAQQGGKPLPLTTKGGRQFTVVDGPAEFDILLECSLPLAIETGRATVTLPRVPAGMVRLNFNITGEETDLKLRSGLITERTSTGGRTNVRATIFPDTPAVLSWSARLPASTPTTAPPKELRFLSDLKTLISVGESDLGLSTLADVTVIQGEASRFEIEIPDGFEVTGASGATLAASVTTGKRLALTITDPQTRSHQFLITLAKASNETKAELSLPAFAATQRETGEVLIEGQGALELAARERGGLRRMDLRESSPQLRGLADASPQAAFRYQKRPNESPGVSLDWVRFPSTPVLSALAGRAVATTLVTREGRSLTEIRLTVQNQSQAFVRVSLPTGAAILTADVAGEKVKPVEASDGNRVPLLRTGFRPTGAYNVSFVISHAGAPFAKKGAGEISLPKLDVPVGALEWEVFLPTEFRIADFGGDALPADLMPRAIEAQSSQISFVEPSAAPVGRGQIGGVLIDPSGAVIVNATIKVTHENGQTYQTATSPNGTWSIPMPQSGRVTIAAHAPGFKTTVRTFDYRAPQPLSVTLRLDVANISESIEVTNPADARRESKENERAVRQSLGSAGPDLAASANVVDLQKRLSGVLPISVTVPRTGNAYRFIRPLVVDEETRLTFQYRTGK